LLGSQNNKKEEEKGHLWHHRKQALLSPSNSDMI